MSNLVIPLFLLILVVTVFQSGSLTTNRAKDVSNAGNGKIEIKPIETGPRETEPVLTLKDAAKVSLVNMIPREDSDEESQDSEALLAVHPDRQLMVGAAYYFTSGLENRTLPLYLSTDGGWSWQLKPRIPVSSLGNQSYCFSSNGKKLYAAILRTPNLDVSVLETDDPVADVPMRAISTLNSEGSGQGDEPFIQVRTFNQDRIYVGQNYFGQELGTGKTAAVRVSVNGGKTFRLLGVEARETIGQDGPPVRPSVAKDGTVYVAFMRWTKVQGQMSSHNMKVTSDIVVTRDDEGAIGPAPFRSLTDPSDDKPGRIIAQNVLVPFSNYLSQHRIGSDLAIAVDPNNSSTVYLAWTDQDPSNNTLSLHLRKSTDRGQNWSRDDLLKIPSAVSISIAVADNGTVGILYQQLLNQGSPQSRWETHFQVSMGGTTSWHDLVLTTFPADRPAKVYDPYLGDVTQLVSFSNHFYGAFSAPNFPDPNNFPQGVRFQRRHKIGQLLANDGTTLKNASIDPYFFHFPPQTEPAFSSLNAPSYTAVATAPDEGAQGLLTKYPLTVPLISGVLLALGFGLSIWWTKYRIPAKVEGTVDRVLGQRIHGPALTNYKGFLTLIFTDETGQVLEGAAPQTKCNLLVRFTPNHPDEGRAEPIDISGGEDAPVVVFKIVVDSTEFKVTPDRKMISVPAKETAESSFEIMVPEDTDKKTLYVQVFQKTRLIQVAAATLDIKEPIEGIG